MATTAHIDSVAIIGAGPSGLAAAKYLLAEKTFSKVRVFEQRDAVGGVWNYTALDPDHAGADDRASDGDTLTSPIYDQLETNIPHSLMRFSDLPFPLGAPIFPPHPVVKAYIETYAADLPASVLCLSTQVVSVKKVAEADSASPKQGPHWQIETLDRTTGRTSTEAFDAVVVASGHYSVPFVPTIPGLDVFRETYPQSVMHAKYYRKPDVFKNKKVVVVGKFASGADISEQVATVSQLPVYISEKSTGAVDDGAKDTPTAKAMPEISRFVVQDRSVVFANGSIVKDVDVVVFCTGYLYQHPFLDSADTPVDMPDGACVRHLYQHVLYADDPTLAFVGVPMRVIPFPLGEAQAAWIARIWSGRLPVPSAAEMHAWEASLVEEKGGDGGANAGRALHIMAWPADVAYINLLHGLSMEASKRPDVLGGDGTGKQPPYWDEETAWVREQCPQIKAACKKLGPKRHKATSLAQLGFVWEEHKKKTEPGSA